MRAQSVRGGLTVLLAAVLLLLAGAIPASAAKAEAKPVGVVDSQRIVKEYGAARDAQEQYQKYLKTIEQEIADKEKALQKYMEDLDSQKMLLGEAALAQKQQEFEKMRTDYFNYREQADAKAEAEYKTRIGPIIDQVRTIAERIGKEEGYGLIIDSATLTTLYIDKSVDLTDKILAALVSGKQ